jgi:hypothetical protein
LSEGLDCLQVRQLQRQDGQTVLCAVVGDLVVRFLGSSCVSCAQYDLVRLGLAQQLLDSFKALPRRQKMTSRWIFAAYQSGGDACGYDCPRCDGHVSISGFLDDVAKAR